MIVNNKFPGYFDPNFNFNNIVSPSKADLVDKLKNMNCSGDIMLEPRLQEYLKKRKFYKENNVEPCISPEKEYQISSTDLKILKSFLQGQRNIYETKTYNKLIEPRQSKHSSNQKNKKYFPSREFRDDSRVPNIDKLKHSNKDTPSNMGMFAPDKGGRHYENPIKSENAILDSRDFPKYEYDGNGFNPNETKFNPRIDPRIEAGIEKQNKYNSQYRVEPEPYQRKTDPDPRNKYIITDLAKSKHEHGKNYVPSNGKTYSGYDDLNAYTDYNLIDLNEKLSPQTRYGNDLLPTYSSASEMDLDNKLVIPSLASNSKKDLNSGSYRFESYYSRGSTRDSELENDLVRGMPSSRPKNKSYGYRNPQENYFDYIDEDYQNSSNSVEAWQRGGEATRLDNKNAAKNRVYNREVR